MKPSLYWLETTIIQLLPPFLKSIDRSALPVMDSFFFNFHHKYFFRLRSRLFGVWVTELISIFSIQPLNSALCQAAFYTEKWLHHHQTYFVLMGCGKTSPSSNHAVIYCFSLAQCNLVFTCLGVNDGFCLALLHVNHISFILLLTVMSQKLLQKQVDVIS